MNTNPDISRFQSRIVELMEILSEANSSALEGKAYDAIQLLCDLHMNTRQYRKLALELGPLLPYESDFLEKKALELASSIK